MWITRFPCPGFEHSQFPLMWATVLWHRGSAACGEASLAERPKKRQLSGIFDWQVRLTDQRGLPRMRQCQKPPPAPELDATGASDERRHRHRERCPHPGWRIQWGIRQSAGAMSSARPAIKAAMERAGVEGARVSEVIIGADPDRRSGPEPGAAGFDRRRYSG